MSNWISEQWRQIRGHLKYDLLRTLVIAAAGSGVIAASGTMLHKRFSGLDSDWFVFGSLFGCSLLLFLLSLFRPGPKPSVSDTNGPVQVMIDSFSETMQLGGLWQVPTSLYNLSIELLEVENENEVTIQVNSGTIQYSGSNVIEISKNISWSRYTLPRASIAEGNECICH